MKIIQQSQPRLNPIRSENFLSRFQIDLVDMRNHKVKKIVNGVEREYQWIAHVIDHFTKFNFMWAQENKMC